MSNIGDDSSSTKSSSSFGSDKKSDNELELEKSTYSIQSVSRPRILQPIRSEATSPPPKPTILTKSDSNSNSKEEIFVINSKEIKNEVSKKSSSTTEIETQTEWSWLQDMQLIQRIKSEGGSLLNEILEDFQSESESGSEAEHDEHFELSKSQAQITSGKGDKNNLDTIGPPKILKFQPESKQAEIVVYSPTLTMDSEPIDNLGQFMKDFNIYIEGGQPCEFCGNATKPWPTINLQEAKNPEALFCCNDYQEFVQGLIEYRIEKDHLVEEAHEQMINKVKNERARQLVKERAEVRNLQLLIAKQKKMEALAQKKKEQDEILQQQQEQRKLKDKDGKDKEKNNQRNQSHALVQVNKLDNKINDDASKDIQNQVTNQARSINYQLSNLKYLQEGWTVRPTTPVDFDEIMEDNEINLFMPTCSQNKSMRRLVIRNYRNGNPCLLLFPDGSGTVFYPSGRIALVISCVATNMHMLSMFSDDENESTLLGYFDPYGNGCVNFPNGKIRMILTPFGGIELNLDGFRRKRWTWWDTTEHVHSPPFQPIVFCLNSSISAKVINQEKISIHFYAENQICKFRVGSKIKIVKPDQIPNAVKMDSNEFFLKRKKSKIDELLGKMCDELNIVKFTKISGLNSRLLTARPQLNRETSLANKREKTILLKLSGINETNNHGNANPNSIYSNPNPNNKKSKTNNSSKFLTIP